MCARVHACAEPCAYKRDTIRHGQKLVINSEHERTCKECTCEVSSGPLRDDAKSAVYMCAHVSTNTHTRCSLSQDGRLRCERVARDLARRSDDAAPPPRSTAHAHTRIADSLSEPAELAALRRLSQRSAAINGEVVDYTHDDYRDNDDDYEASDDDDDDAAADDDIERTMRRERRRVAHAQRELVVCPSTANCEQGVMRLRDSCCDYCRGAHDFCASHARHLCHPLAICRTRVSMNATTTTTTTKTLGLDDMLECECPSGYAGDGRLKCQDVDECAAGALNRCDAKSTECVNTAGGYECRCRAGFERVNAHMCADINECARNSTNACHWLHARCINTHGSYRCHCVRGFLGNGRECHRWLHTPDAQVATYLHTHSAEQPSAQQHAKRPLGSLAESAAGAPANDDEASEGEYDDDDGDDSDDDEQEDEDNHISTMSSAPSLSESSSEALTWSQQVSMPLMLLAV